MRVGKPIILLAALLTVGCAESQVAQRAYDHMKPMRPYYDHGASTFPGATDTDKRIADDHWTELEVFLKDAGAK